MLDIIARRDKPHRSPVVDPRDYFSPVLTATNLPLSLVPTPFTAVMIASANAGRDQSVFNRGCSGLIGKKISEHPGHRRRFLAPREIARRSRTRKSHARSAANVVRALDG
jgi:hypothetical protein